MNKVKLEDLSVGNYVCAEISSGVSGNVQLTPPMRVVSLGEGDEYWSYGGHEHHAQKFPLEYLWLKDDEIKTMVNKAVEDKEKQIKERKEKEQREQLERKYKQYEDLKRQFESL